MGGDFFSHTLGGWVHLVTPVVKVQQPAPQCTVHNVECGTFDVVGQVGVEACVVRATNWKAVLSRPILDLVQHTWCAAGTPQYSAAWQEMRARAEQTTAPSKATTVPTKATRCMAGKESRQAARARQGRLSYCYLDTQRVFSHTQGVHADGAVCSLFLGTAGLNGCSTHANDHQAMHYHRR